MQLGKAEELEQEVREILCRNCDVKKAKKGLPRKGCIPQTKAAAAQKGIHIEEGLMNKSVTGLLIHILAEFQVQGLTSLQA